MDLGKIYNWVHVIRVLVLKRACIHQVKADYILRASLYILSVSNSFEEDSMTQIFLGVVDHALLPQ